jgi:septum formation protein
VRELVLASTSQYRRALMERLGVPFRCRPPQVDEEALKADADASAPRALAEHLALAKAASLGREERRATVIGCDQLVAFDGRAFGKPGSVEAAVDQLAAMSGRTHELITALAVWHDGQTFLHTDVTILRMRALGRDEIARYVAADRPLDCAGAYKFERRGIVLFDRVDAQDHAAIVGLPLMALTTILRMIGFAIP